MEGIIERNKVYTLKEARVLLKVPESTFRLLIRRAEIRGRKIGRHWRFLGSDLLNLFQSQTSLDKGRKTH